MNFDDWFDPYNMEHVSAYRHLERNGTWPEGFIPDDVEVRSDGLWNIIIVGKMAQAWLSTMENGEIS